MLTLQLLLTIVDREKTFVDDFRMMAVLLDRRPLRLLSLFRRNDFSCVRSYALFHDAGSSSQSTSPCGHLTRDRHNSSLHEY